jgi:acyl carrier protein
MTEADFMRLVSSVRRVDDDALLDLPLEDAPFDSLDLLELRCALEIRLGRNLSDDKFIASSTLRDLYRLVAQ